MSTLTLLAIYHSRRHLPLLVSLQRLCTWWNSWKVPQLHHSWSAHGQNVIQGYDEHWWPERAEDEASKPYFIRRLEISWQDGCLLWGCQVIVPPPGRRCVLEELHSTHTGIYRTESYVRAFVWWPKLDEQIEQTVHDCSVCQSNQKSPPEVPMQTWQWSNKPWDRVHVDHFGPYRSKMFFLLVNSHSKWVEVSPMSSSSSAVTLNWGRGLLHMAYHRP